MDDIVAGVWRRLAPSSEQGTLAVRRGAARAGPSFIVCSESFVTETAVGKARRKKDEGAQIG